MMLGCAGPSNAQTADPERIRRDIVTLAHDRWEGRQTCTPGLDSAAAFIAGRFRQLGLTPAGGASGTPDFYHRYTARPQTGPHGVAPAELAACASQNVVALIRGTDPALRDEYVIVGAHYDHLGRSVQNALDPGSLDSIRNGADDNASGTAGLLELARLLRERPTKRSVLVVAFSGEEWGILGSSKYAEEKMPPATTAMLNFDMIGRMKGDTVIVFGTGTAVGMDDVLDRANTAAPLVVRRNPDGNGNSDQAAFHPRRIPVLHFFTGMHEDYHRASDESPRINARGAARVVDFALRALRDIADAPVALTYTAPPPRPAAPAASGARPYLGSIPDMAGGDRPGLRISGVSPGTPAERGGLRAGDLVVEFGGHAVTDLQTYSDALNAFSPGDTVKIVVERGTERVTLTVVLGTRSR
jgi:hypothetical protein